MNPILNNLYLYYKSQSDLFDNNINLLSDQDETYRIYVTSNLHILSVLREDLYKKNYISAKRLVQKLSIAPKYENELKELVNCLEENNKTFDLELKNIPQTINLILLEEILKKHVNITPAADTIQPDVIQKLSNYLNQLSSDHENILQLSHGLSNLSTTILEQDKLLKQNQENFATITSKMKDTTISTVETITKSSLNTSITLVNEIPDKVARIINDATEKMNEQLNNTLHNNLMLYAMILFILLLISLYFMGKLAGHTIVQDILNLRHTQTK